MKRQITAWEKIFAIPAYRSFVSRIYKKQSKFKNEKMNNPIKLGKIQTDILLEKIYGWQIST